MKRALYKISVLGLLFGLIVSGFSPDLTPYSITVEQAVVEVVLDKEAFAQLLDQVAPYIELISAV